MIDRKHPASEAQIRAATPQRSTWVSANAGSGKTRVLTDRVARLLLSGTDPMQILCLTYTKAAAAEMQNRLFSRLGQWAMMPDAALRAQLSELGEREASITTEQLRRSRTLFARALETPGGLKIQTIHAFCDRLLRRFPLEAGVSPGFEMLEDRQSAQLRADILDGMAETPEFTAYAPWLAADAPDKTLMDILSNRAAFATPMTEEDAMATFGVEERQSTAEHILSILEAISPNDLSALMDALEQKGGKGAEVHILQALKIAQTPESPPAQTFKALTQTILTKAGEPRKSGFPTKAVKEALPEAHQLATALADAAQDAIEAQRAEAAALRTHALHQFAHAFLTSYATAKSVLNLLDFDDLITKAQTLLQDSPSAAWVQYKMDNGIDHILVDEAQDTSPAQWAVINALTDDFFAGQSAVEKPRTVFVVGDEKQSIYSFQGADPVAFGSMRNRYAKVLDEAAMGLETTELQYSFRSAAPILALVDQVFRQSPVHGLGQNIQHATFREAKPGRVDLWPFIEAPAKEEDAPWDTPVDMPPKGNPAIELAQEIADWAEDLLASGRALPGTATPIQPRDILILVRSRGPIFKAIIAALTKAQIPVSGADRLKLTDALAVKDLLSLLRFLATEADDLALAEVLRSPLGGLTEAELYSLAQPRKGTLWQALRHSHHTELAEHLSRLRNQSDFLRPFELLHRALTTQGGRKKLTARLGAEAGDAIDALMDLALQYDSVEAPTLTGFLEWITATEAEVKRQLDGTTNQIRVMTIHGAKGLEAPIVLLPQTHDPTRGAKTPKLIAASGQIFPYISAEERPKALAPLEEARKARELEEAWRLLYVGLTRAESWLIICGGGPRKNDADMEWYTTVEDAMREIATPHPAGGQSLAFDWELAPAEAATSAQPANPLPEWSQQPGPKPPAAPDIIAPSREAEGPHALAGTEGEDTTLAMARGTAIHTLLDHLAHTPALSDEAAAALLTDPLLPPVAHPALIEEARATRSAPELAWIWAGNALSEVPVAGRVKALGHRILRGRIDHLILGEEIWAIDFKSNRTVPTTPKDIPEALIGQMALYHTALAEIFPGQPIRTALVWTAAQSLMEIPHNIVTEALQSYTKY